MWMTRIDELEYLMHEESLLYNQRQGFDHSFLEVSRKKKEKKMMEGFDEADLVLRSLKMFKRKNIIITYLRRHKRCFLSLVHC